MSVNRVILIGNLGKDPELRHTNSGDAVCNFSLATSEAFKDKDGKRQTKTQWHNIVVWRQLAEICGKYLHKGKQIYCEGKIETRKWQNDEGDSRYATEIVLSQMLMLGGRDDSQNKPEDDSHDQPRQTAQHQQQHSQPAQSNDESAFKPEDDIPF